MINKNEFPYTLGGYVEQQSYKGYDIAISIIKYKGISVYAFSSEKRMIWQESRSFGDKDELFQWGRDAIDRHIESQQKKTEEAVIKRTEYYTSKGKLAALAAFRSAMYFSNINGKEYEEALGFFQYELDKQFDKLK